MEVETSERCHTKDISTYDGSKGQCDNSTHGVQMKRWIGMAIVGLITAGCAPKNKDKDSSADTGVIGETGEPGETGDTDDTDETGNSGDTGDTEALTTVTLSGVITRSATLTEDGDGLAAVWIYNVNPDEVAGRLEPDNPQILPANFTDTNTEIAFSIEEIAPQTNPFWVLAIFDDNGSGWQMGPGTGDLLALDGENLHQIVMDVPGEWELNLDLNTVHPTKD